jgi:hypothetical protein
MDVNSAFPSRCLQSTTLSASALAMRSFHTTTFPLPGGEIWISCPIVFRPALRCKNFSEQSGCASKRSLCFP